MGVVLCKGSPLVAVEVGKNHAVVLAPGGAGGGRAGRVVAVDAAPAGDLRAVTLRDNSTWALATLGDGCELLGGRQTPRCLEDARNYDVYPT